MSYKIETMTSLVLENGNDGSRGHETHEIARKKAPELDRTVIPMICQSPSVLRSGPKAFVNRTFGAVGSDQTHGPDFSRPFQIWFSISCPSFSKIPKGPYGYAT